MAKTLKTILSVVGTRPNYMKVGPLEESFQNYDDIRHLILHTGQHFDRNMSEAFFKDFNLRAPDLHLGVHGGSIGEQTGRLMQALDVELKKLQPDMVIVVGDVNSTFAAAWVAAQNQIAVAHVEAGLRSFDRRMPEEINRICTDAVADLLFITHPSASQQLEKEGVPSSKIFMVGDIMIDYLMRYREAAQAMKLWQQHQLQPQQYGLVTLHRPSNVDNVNTLKPLLQTLSRLATQLPLLFAVHPRTRQSLEQHQLWQQLQADKNIHLTPPLSYLEFLSLMLGCKLVLTDSGGIQEETTFLNIPCLTLRENTERPFCIEHGTNYLVGTQPEKIIATFQQLLHGNAKTAQAMPGWDGQTAGRITQIVHEQLTQS